MLITGIVAIAENGVIGNEQGMPWPRDAEDLAFFRQQTMGKPCIVGRKTFEHMEELGVKWGTRTPFIISRQPKIQYFSTINEAIYNASALHKQVMVIGGAEIYQLAMPYMTTMIITHIEGNYQGHATLKLNHEWESVCVMGRREIFAKKR